MAARCPRRTVLELVRDMATDLVSDGARVKVCVQQALGQGVFQVGLMHMLDSGYPAAWDGVGPPILRCMKYLAACCNGEGMGDIASLLA